MEEDKRKHLEFIQNIITRMNANSFAIKNWTIVVITALIYLYVQSTDKKSIYIIVAIMPTILFWFLDSYYLWMETKYRMMYDDIVKNGYNEEFKPYTMPFKQYKYSFFKVFISKTILPLYLTLLLGIILLNIIM